MIRYNKLVVRLTLRQLLLIIQIDDTGSLKQAALQIGLSQPRATKALQEIELLLEQKLFNRTNRGMFTTIAGECVIRYARSMIAQAENLQDELENLTKEHWSRIRIGIIMGAVPIATASIKLFLKKHPNTSFEIIEDTSIELLRLLDNGYLDLVVGRSSVSPTTRTYDHFTFYEESLAIIANPKHALVDRKKIHLSDLSQSTWIVYTSQMPMRISLEQEYRLEGLAFPRALIETRSAFATMAMIQSDAQYIALLAKDVADFFIKSGMAKLLPYRMKIKSEPYEIITRSNVALTPSAAEFMHLIIQKAWPE